MWFVLFAKLVLNFTETSSDLQGSKRLKAGAESDLHKEHPGA